MNDCVHTFGQQVCHRCGMAWYGVSADFDKGAATAFGLMGMAIAIGENDRVRACPHCGHASFARAYCEHGMCDPAECHYWICNDCHETGRGHSVAPCMSKEQEVKRG